MNILHDFCTKMDHCENPLENILRFSAACGLLTRSIRVPMSFLGKSDPTIESLRYDRNSSGFIETATMAMWPTDQRFEVIAVTVNDRFNEPSIIDEIRNWPLQEIDYLTSHQDLTVLKTRCFDVAIDEHKSCNDDVFEEILSRSKATIIPGHCDYVKSDGDEYYHTYMVVYRGRHFILGHRVHRHPDRWGILDDEKRITSHATLLVTLKHQQKNDPIAQELAQHLLDHFYEEIGVKIIVPDLSVLDELVKGAEPSEEVPIQKLERAPEATPLPVPQAVIEPKPLSPVARFGYLLALFLKRIKP